ncbi:RHS repeat-associated core domain-containing protein [Herbivorax sp. ANBcel31]|uniref:RHS repeat-associated core domain-containing protein n=1 Tax=Herbivorax sp. ANBcel31 TaxID=3069754 RepID=UPI0027AFF8CD|nr:RHS repeat-associated core domain-containing protein [Herbivorax sp. ANBcel31]MDQ2087662.1 RHS repeat-associated core domain-containing protein [Herbivorax sp. ANBcel31]
MISNTYDDKNQLVRTEANGKTVVNTYNGEGLRVAKEVNGSLTRYLYEYDKVVLEVNGAGQQIARNLYGTNLLMRTVEDESYYYMYNGHADVTALINVATGTIDATYYYDAFGNILEQTGDVNNNITYAGYQWDEETGLYYLNARMYDPKIARFLQEDTYRGDPNDPLTLNLYAYTANNPIRYYDPTGYSYVEIFCIPFGNPIDGARTVFNREKRTEAC